MSHESAPATSSVNTHLGSPTVACTLLPQSTPDRPRLRLSTTNASSGPIYLLDGQRLPYLILQQDGSLLVLHGVNPPDPNTLYNLIEIPVTRALGPGEERSWEIEVSGANLHDHYGSQPPRSLTGEVVIHSKIGWGITPITASDRVRMSITDLLTWQRLAEGPVLRVSIREK